MKLEQAERILVLSYLMSNINHASDSCSSHQVKETILNKMNAYEAWSVGWLTGYEAGKIAAYRDMISLTNHEENRATPTPYIERDE